ncbi:hypothetical protein QYF61_017468 [Mycteria americana]|uniref:Uncharacterized protein n=1 Tax=Mycteria americana TaxID=33587 RepID=A0AAN7PHJ7_MYCAM|nr:hypothetical protein QYF61_017468 [Mycteria americana]
MKATLISKHPRIIHRNPFDPKWVFKKLGYQTMDYRKHKSFANCSKAQKEYKTVLTTFLHKTNKKTLANIHDRELRTTRRDRHIRSHDKGTVQNLINYLMFTKHFEDERNCNINGIIKSRNGLDITCLIDITCSRKGRHILDYHRHNSANTIAQDGWLQEGLSPEQWATVLQRVSQSHPEDRTRCCCWGQQTWKLRPRHSLWTNVPACYQTHLDTALCETASGHLQGRTPWVGHITCRRPPNHKVKAAALIAAATLCQQVQPHEEVFVQAPFRYWKAAIRSPHSLIFSRLNNPNSLSLSAQERCSSPLIIFVALLWTHSNRPMSFLCWGPQSGMQYSVGWGLMRAGYRGRITSLDLLVTLLLMQPRIWLAFWAASAHCWLMLSFSSTNTPKSFSSGRAALNPFSAQPVFVLGIAPTHVQDLALGPVELHEVRTGPPLKPVRVPLEGIPSLWHVNSTTQLGDIGKLAEGALNPTVHVADKDVKQRWFQYRPLRNATCPWFPLGHRAVDRNSLSVTMQPISYPPSSPSIKSMSLQFRDKDVVQDSVKCFAQIQGILSPPPSKNGIKAIKMVMFSMNGAPSPTFKLCRLFSMLEETNTPSSQNGSFHYQIESADKF